MTTLYELYEDSKFEFKKDEILFHECAFCTAKMMYGTTACYDCGPRTFSAELINFEKAREFFQKEAPCLGPLCEEIERLQNLSHIFINKQK